MASINRKISPLDTIQVMMEKYNMLTTDVMDLENKNKKITDIENRLSNLENYIIDQYKEKTPSKEDKKENSQNRFNFLMECALELQKICSENATCDKCPFSSDQGYVCKVGTSIPKFWNLQKEGDYHG